MVFTSKNSFFTAKSQILHITSGAACSEEAFKFEAMYVKWQN